MGANRPRIAIAVSPRLLGDALERVLVGAGAEVVLILDDPPSSRDAASHFDVLLTDGSLVTPIAADRVIDLRDEPDDPATATTSPRVDLAQLRALAAGTDG